MTNNKAVLAKMQCGVVTEEGPVTINCAMYFAETDPFEVVFMSQERTEDGEPVEWHYSRDLLAQGLKGEMGLMYGDGDVQLYKEGKFIFTIFTQGDRKCLIAFAPDDMQTFLDETEKIVPLGAEQIDVDAELAKLLAEE